MSASGRASDFMQAWGEGHGKPHNPGHKAWGADDCDACTAEAFDPWEALVHAARIAGFLRDEQARAVTAVPPPVPPEIVRRAAEAIRSQHWDGTGCGTHGTSACSRCYGPSPADAGEVAYDVLAAVYGDIVEAARRDALAPLRDLAERWRDCQPGAFYPEASAYANGIESCGESLIDALDDLAAGNPTAETAPPRALTASVSDQGADPRTPTTPGAQIGVQSDD